MALSHDAHWLLSASVAPPTIQLTNLSSNTHGVFIRPRCSSSAVVAADFHPDRSHVFLLAFADGACALYDVARLVRRGDDGHRDAEPADSRTGGEISNIERIHAIAGSIPITDLEWGFLGPAESASPGVGEMGIGITAAALVPASRAKAVTVGADGKCCVVDFFTRGKKKSSVLRTWHIQGSATSLALLSSWSKPISDTTEQDYAPDLNQPRRRVLVAIGRQDGKVLLYDLSGRLLQDCDFSRDRSRIIELEWTSDAAGLGINQPGGGFAVPSHRYRGKSLDATPAEGIPVAEVVSVIDGANDELGVSHLESIPQRKSTSRLPRQPHSADLAFNHLDCFSTTETSRHGQDNNITKNPPVSSNSDNAKRGQVNRSSRLRGNVYAEVQSSMDGPSYSRPPKPDPVPILPPFHSRPFPRQVKAPPIDHGVKGHQDISGADGISRRDLQQALDSHPNGSALFPPAQEAEMIAAPHAAGARGQPYSAHASHREEAAIRKPLDDDDWMDVTTGSRRPIRQHKRKVGRLERSKDRKASSAVPPGSPVVSETSDDIVVEWPSTSARQAPSNALLPGGLPEIPPRPRKSRKKTRPSSSMSKDSIVQWSSFKKGHVFAMRNGGSNPTTQLPPAKAPPKGLGGEPPSKQQPLAETSHHPRHPPLAPTESPSRPAPPPLTSNPTIPTEASEPSTPFQANIRTLRDAVKLQLQAQSTWLDGKLRDLGEGTMRMEEEIRRLREELQKRKMEERATKVKARV